MGEKKGLRGLQAWCRKLTEGYRDVDVRDLSSSFRDGLAFCAIIHHFRPDLIDYDSLFKENILENNSLAFRVAEKQLGIPALLDAEDMVMDKQPDKLSIATYLSQFYQYFEGGQQHSRVKTSINKRPLSERNSDIFPNKIPAVVSQQKFEVCQACRQRVFILERLIVDGKLYHRTCFKCTKCGALLKPGAYVEGDNTGTYECAICPEEEVLQSQSEHKPNNEKISLITEEEVPPVKPEREKYKIATHSAIVRQQYLTSNLKDGEKDDSLCWSSGEKDTKNSIFKEGNELVNSVSRSLSEPTSVTTENISSTVENDVNVSELPVAEDKVPTETSLVCVVGDQETSAVSEESNRNENSKSEMSNGNNHNNERDLKRSQREVLTNLSISSSITVADDTVNETTDVLAVSGTNKVGDVKPEDSVSEQDTGESSVLSNDITATVSAGSDIVTSNGVYNESYLKRSKGEDSVTKEDQRSVDSQEQVVRSKSEPFVYKSPFAKRQFYSSIGIELPVIRSSVYGLSNKIGSLSVDTYKSPLTFSSQLNLNLNQLVTSSGTTSQDIGDASTVDDNTNSPKVVETGAEKHAVSCEFDLMDEQKGDRISSSLDTSLVHSCEEGSTDQVSSVLDVKTQPLEERNMTDQTSNVMEVGKSPHDEVEIVTSQSVSSVLNIEDVPSDEIKTLNLTTDVSITAKSPTGEADTSVNQTSNVLDVTQLPSGEVCMNRNEINDELREGEISYKEVKLLRDDIAEYPDDLNPFGDDEETSEDESEEYPESLNPFESSEDEDDEYRKAQTLPLQRTEVYHEDYDRSLNPFGSTDESETEEATEPIISSPETYWQMIKKQQNLRERDKGSTVAGPVKATTITHKKRKAPSPPVNKDANKYSGVSGFQCSTQNLSVKVDDTENSALSPVKLAENPDSNTSLIIKTTQVPDITQIKPATPSPLSKKRAAPKPPASPQTPSKSEGMHPNKMKGPTTSEAQKEKDNGEIKLQPEETQNEKENKETSPSAENKTVGYLKKKKRPAPPVPIPPRRQIRKIPVEEIQSEMKNIEQQQEELEEIGRELEMKIRDLNTEAEPTLEEEESILELFDLVNQKNSLFRRQAELMYLKRSQRLEEEQVELEFQIRCLMSKPNSFKNEADQKQEEELIQRLLDVVEQRNDIVDSIETNRRREVLEDHSIQEEMTQKKSDISEKGKTKKKKIKQKKLKIKDKKHKFEEKNKEDKTLTKPKKKGWLLTA